MPKPINLNKLARRVTLKEGGKKSLAIGNVKEVIKLFLLELCQYEHDQVMQLLTRYRKRIEKPRKPPVNPWGGCTE